MSQLQLRRVSKDIIDHAENAVVPEQGMSKVVDDYFVQKLKEDELQHAEVDARLYEGMRKTVQKEVLPLYEKFKRETSRIRERKQKRKVWQYTLGTIGFCEILEAIATHGRSISPQVLIPSAILYSFIGLIIYVAAQYIDDVQLTRARARLEKSLENIERQVQTDADRSATLTTTPRKPCARVGSCAGLSSSTIWCSSPRSSACTWRRRRRSQTCKRCPYFLPSRRSGLRPASTMFVVPHSLDRSVS